MKNAKFASRRVRRRGCFFVLLLAATGILGEAASAQNGPPISKTLNAKNGEAVTLPKALVTILRGRIN